MAAGIKTSVRRATVTFSPKPADTLGTSIFTRDQTAPRPAPSKGGNIMEWIPDTSLPLLWGPKRRPRVSYRRGNVKRPRARNPGRMSNLHKYDGVTGNHSQQRYPPERPDNPTSGAPPPSFDSMYAGEAATGGNHTLPARIQGLPDTHRVDIFISGAVKYEKYVRMFTCRFCAALFGQAIIPTRACGWFRQCVFAGWRVPVDTVTQLALDADLLRNAGANDAGLRFAVIQEFLFTIKPWEWELVMRGGGGRRRPPCTVEIRTQISG
jgi:hypothetical protein